MRKILVYLCLYIIFSCDDKDSKSHMRYNYGAELKEKVMKGDKRAYKLLLTVYFKDNNFEDLLAYSLIMANKYDSPNACYDVFTILQYSSFNHQNKNCKERSLYINCLDRNTRLVL